MAKRTKRIEKGIESIKSEIENHFNKIENDILEGNMGRGKYHIKEIDRSLLMPLETKLNILRIKNDKSLSVYKERLKKLKKILGLEEQNF